MRRREGLTVIELLVAAALFGVILSITSVFLTQEMRLNRMVEGRNDVNNQLRVILQMLEQDLQMAGASQHVSGGKATTIPILGAVLAGGDGGVRDEVTVRYATSLQGEAQACRFVAYGWKADGLHRVDLKCADAAGQDLSTLMTDANLLSGDLLALDVRYLCSDGTIVASVAAGGAPCGTDAYVRSSDVSVVAAVPDREAPARTVTTLSGQSVSCSAETVCLQRQQQILMPNLKDR